MWDRLYGQHPLFVCKVKMLCRGCEDLVKESSRQRPEASFMTKFMTKNAFKTQKLRFYVTNS